MANLGCDGGSVGTPLALGEAITILAAKLDDPGLVHWTQAELTRYLVEALRTTSALTQRWRNRASFPTAFLQPFYDLPTVLPTLRPYTVTDRDLVLDVQYALMEMPNATTWSGTTQFTYDMVVEAIQSRLDQFLMETGAVQTRQITSVTPDSNGRIPLDPAVVTVRRAAWIMADETVVPLKREDEWAMSHYAFNWPQIQSRPQQTWPVGYSVGVTPPLTLQLAPVPYDPFLHTVLSGRLDLVAVQTGATLTPGSVATPLGIPDDWTWVVKWGALAELLSRDGLAYDPDRAAYCEARYQQGVTLAKAASVVLQGYINDVPVLLRSLAETDTYRRTWQTTPGAPTAILLAGQNLLGLNPKPDSINYTITVDVVANVLVPTDLTDCLQIDEPMRDPFFDYAQHLATFKEGPTQAQSTMALVERFMRACGVTVSIEQASVPNRGPLLQQTSQDVRVKDREQVPEPSLP